MFIPKFIAMAFVVVGLLCPHISARAAVDCPGKVFQVYKWNNMTSLSMRVKLADGSTTNWISLPTKSDEAAALMALAAGKPVWVYWATPSITNCVNGWDHNKPLEGYFVVGE